MTIYLKNFHLHWEKRNYYHIQKLLRLHKYRKQKVISDLYTVKKSEKFVKELISSNEKLSRANSKYALALNILTGALVLLGLIQIVIAIFNTR